MIFKVVVPAASPFIMTGLRIALAIALILVVISEMVGATSGIGYFILQGRRDLASKQAVKKRLDLRQIVDRVAFRESDFVKQVEGALHGIETEGAEELARRIDAFLARYRRLQSEEPARPVYVISALAGEGCTELTRAVAQYLEQVEQNTETDMAHGRTPGLDTDED